MGGQNIARAGLMTQKIRWNRNKDEQTAYGDEKIGNDISKKESRIVELAFAILKIPSLLRTRTFSSRSSPFKLIISVAEDAAPE